MLVIIIKMLYKKIKLLVIIWEKKWNKIVNKKISELGVFFVVIIKYSNVFFSFVVNYWIKNLSGLAIGEVKPTTTATSRQMLKIKNNWNGLNGDCHAKNKECGYNTQQQYAAPMSLKVFGGFC